MIKGNRVVGVRMPLRATAFARPATAIVVSVLGLAAAFWLTPPLARLDDSYIALHTRACAVVERRSDCERSGAATGDRRGRCGTATVSAAGSRTRSRAAAGVRGSRS